MEGGDVRRDEVDRVDTVGDKGNGENDEGALAGEGEDVGGGTANRR